MAAEVFATVKTNVCGSERDTFRAAQLLSRSEREDCHRVYIAGSSEASDKHEQRRDDFR